MARSEELFEQGKNLFLRGQYARAEQLLATAAELTPTSVGCQFMLGASRMNSDDVAGALYPLALCVYFEPDHGSARFALGVALRHLGQPEQANVHIAYAAYLGNPQAPAMLTQLGLAHCTDCGGPVTPNAAGCDTCAATPRSISSPRRRTWSWAHLRADDFRSRLSLPGEQVAQIARGHLTRYDLEGDPRNIDDALTYLELAAAAAPDAERPLRLTELGSAYRRRFACHGLPADLDHAIDCHEQALDRAGADADERVMILANLGVAYGARYEFGAVAADLERAIQFLERAMATPTQDPDQRLAVMANAGQFYRHRFQAGNDPADLDRSIELQIPVVDGTLLTILATPGAWPTSRSPTRRDTRRTAGPPTWIGPWTSPTGPLPRPPATARHCRSGCSIAAVRGCTATWRTGRAANSTAPSATCGRPWTPRPTATRWWPPYSPSSQKHTSYPVGIAVRRTGGHWRHGGPAGVGVRRLAERTGPGRTQPGHPRPCRWTVRPGRPDPGRRH